MKRQRYYQMMKNGNTADIYIYGDIDSRAEMINSWYDDDTGATSARGIVKEIQELDVDIINVYINSYGGEVAEALAIYSALKRHKANVHTFCDGFACSAASVVFCAGATRTIGSIALLMIHDCMSYVGMANSAEMRKIAEDNDKINASSINAYKEATGLEEKKIKQMMRAETWLTAQECLDYGFATEIAETEEGEGGAQQSAFGLVRDAILAKQNGEADPIIQRIERLEKRLFLGPEEKSDPEEKDPESNGSKTTEKAKRFFEKLFHKEEER